MTEINLNMSVSVPDEIYEKFLIKLGRDGFVFAKFGEYSLVLSMPDIEPLCKLHGLIEIRDGEYDLSAVDGKHGGTGRRQASAKKSQAEEHAGRNPAHPTQSIDGKIVRCKCGHWIGFVGTKWQHLDIKVSRTTLDEAYTPPKSVFYLCTVPKCIKPTPVEER